MKTLQLIVKFPRRKPRRMSLSQVRKIPANKIVKAIINPQPQ